MNKNPNAGKMSLTVERKQRYVFGRNYNTASPSFMHEGNRLVTDVYLDINVFDVWDNAEFILKNMYTGKKIIDKKRFPNPFDLSKPLKVNRLFIGGNYEDKRTHFTSLPSGVPIQGRLKLKDGLFFSDELPEDNSRIILPESIIIGEIPDAKITLSHDPVKLLSCNLFWNIEIGPVLVSSIESAKLEVYVYDKNSAVYALYPGSKNFIYSEELPISDNGIKLTNKGQVAPRVLAGNNARAFLTIKNKDGNICVYSTEIAINGK